MDITLAFTAVTLVQSAFAQVLQCEIQSFNPLPPDLFFKAVPVKLQLNGSMTL